MPNLSRACCSTAKERINNNEVKSCCKKETNKNADKKCSCCNKPSKNKKKSCKDCNNYCHCATSVSAYALINHSFIQENEVSFFGVRNIYNNYPFQFASSNFASIWVPPKIKLSSI
jgi:hypothetical protein